LSHPHFDIQRCTPKKETKETEEEEEEDKYGQVTQTLPKVCKPSSDRGFDVMMVYAAHI